MKDAGLAAAGVKGGGKGAKGEEEDHTYAR